MAEYSGVESSDINDKDILDATKQSRDEKGLFSFTYTMPDGHKITSEKFNQDQQRKAVMAWCDVVRGVIIQRSKEQAAQKSRRKMVVEEDQTPIVDITPVRPVREAVRDIIQQAPKPVAIEITEPTEREEYCMRPGPMNVALGNTDYLSADDYVENKIATLQRELAKWIKVRKALQE